jgi:hypothetical protein
MEVNVEYAPGALKALLLCFKLHEFTMVATLRQLIMFVIDKIIEEGRRLLLANKL